MSVRTLSENSPEPLRRPDLRAVRDDASCGQLPLALHWEVSPGVPAVPEVPRPLHVVGGTSEELPELPEPGMWVATLARAVSEVMVGERPVAQLTRHLTREQFARVSGRAAAMARHPSARAQRGKPRARAVRAVRICPVAPGVIEASAVLVGGDRSQAIALRIEVVAGRWLATVVDLR